MTTTATDANQDPAPAAVTRDRAEAMTDAAEVNELRRQLDEERTKNSTLASQVSSVSTELDRHKSHYGKYDQEQHSRLTQYQPDILDVMERFKKNPKCTGAVSSELASMEDWCKSYTSAACGMEMNKHAPIATFAALASEEIKMVTAEASAGSEARAALSEKSKRLEEVEEKNAALELKLKGRDEQLSKNRTTIDALIAEGQKYGVYSTQASMDFSKVAAREKEMEEVANAVAGGALDPTNVEVERPAAPALAVGTVSASSKALGKRPMSTPMDPLLEELLKHSTNGSTRVMPSGTGNSWIGSAGLAASDAGVAPDLAAIIRSI
jgi:hypothetical protein